MNGKEQSGFFSGRRKIRLILTGTDHLWIENYEKVVLFETERICLTAGGRELVVHGRGLWMEHYDKFDLLIRGEITSVAYPGNGL